MRQQNDAHVPHRVVHHPRVYDEVGHVVLAHHVKRLVVDVEKRHDAQRAHRHAQLHAEQLVQAADRSAQQPMSDSQRLDGVRRVVRRPSVLGVRGSGKTRQARGPAEPGHVFVDGLQLAVQRETLFGELRLRTAHGHVLDVDERVQDHRLHGHGAAVIGVHPQHVQTQHVDRHDQQQAGAHGRGPEHPAPAGLGHRRRRVRLVALHRLPVLAVAHRHRVRHRDPRQHRRHVRHARVDLLQGLDRLGGALLADPAHDRRRGEQRVRARHRQQRGEQQRRRVNVPAAVAHVGGEHAERLPKQRDRPISMVRHIFTMIHMTIVVAPDGVCRDTRLYIAIYNYIII